MVLENAITCSCPVFPAPLTEKTVSFPLYIIAYFVIGKLTRKSFLNLKWICDQWYNCDQAGSQEQTGTENWLYCSQDGSLSSLPAQDGAVPIMRTKKRHIGHNDATPGFNICECRSLPLLITVAFLSQWVAHRGTQRLLGNYVLPVIF